MPRITITKEFSFEAAHALEGYDGPCRNIHGHSYKLAVTVTGSRLTGPSSPKKGMIMDFGDLKSIVNTTIIEPFDHALILPRDTSLRINDNDETGFPKLKIVDYQPTSENLLLDFAAQIGRLLPQGIRLVKIRLQETSTSFAEWEADPAD